MTNTHRFATLLLALVTLSLPLQADDNSAWMSRLTENPFVSQLSIPGAHDAATGHGFRGALSWLGSYFAETQTLTLTEQWNTGVRVFDLRPSVDGSTLYIYHGIVGVNLTMQAALETLCSLLDQHPTEMAIVIMRHEDDHDDGDANWNTMMNTLLTGNTTIASHTIAFTPEMRLDDARGKLLILSRNEYASTPVGGFVRNWNNQKTNFSEQQGGTIVGPSGISAPCYVQDVYDVESHGVSTKTSCLQRMLQFSTQENTNPGLWVMNAAAGYSKQTSILSYTFPASDGYADNAATQNPVVINYVNDHAGPTGIIYLDYAGVNSAKSKNVRGLDLVNAVVNSNFTEGPHADYFRALGKVKSGTKYVVSTTVNGTKYYLTAEGTLTTSLSQAGFFTFSRVAGDQYKYGYQLLPSYFTNPPAGGNPTLNNGRINTDAGSHRNNWEAQVLFRNSQGKYAIRATNATGGESGWAVNAKTFWTVNTSGPTPLAEYSFDKEYIWSIERSLTVLNVTCNIMHKGQLLKSVVVEHISGSAAQLPEEYDNKYTSYSYSPATVDGSHTTVTVEATFETPFHLSKSYATARWYYLRGHANVNAWGDSYVFTDGNSIGWGEGYEDTDVYRWAFLGDPISGIQLINKATGEGAYLNNTDPASMVSTPYAWEFRKQTAFYGSTGEPEGVQAFLFFDAGRNQFLNVYGNDKVLRYWNNSDHGSTFWIENAEPDFLLGDVNSDEIITIADVTALVNIILGKDNGPAPLYRHVAADVNEDGGITIADVTSLVNLILGKQ